jgi:hypothetical protein
MKIADRKIPVEKPIFPKVILDDSIPDLSQHPVVVAKVERARAFLKKHPVPEHLLRK